MADEPTELLKELIRNVNDMRTDFTARFDQLEQERVQIRQRMQAVEQHAAVFVENSAITNKRLDDIDMRLESQPVR
ncbi:MAG: hypothetical protein GDA50_08185 [Alphaproteobacteria bacterium GM202ARS2]|nr:hypothetical protein [Alphaproteobacteria bacterium GM202ARS2]